MGRCNEFTRPIDSILRENVHFNLNKISGYRDEDSQDATESQDAMDSQDTEDSQYAMETL